MPEVRSSREEIERALSLLASRVSWQRSLERLAAHADLALFALVGLVHGYALGESIYGAEQTPLYAYLLGLAVIQSAIALVAMAVARSVAGPSKDLAPLRLIGAGIAGIGLAVLM